MNKTDSINLFTTDELVDELKRRHPDGIIVAYQLPKHEIKDQKISWRCGANGDVGTINKLANIALHHAYELTMPEDMEDLGDDNEEEIHPH